MSFLHKSKDSTIFHGGTKESEGKIITSGGRVFAITSFGKNIQDACKKSYSQIDEIKFEKAYFRKDIGLDLLKDRESNKVER